MKSKNITSDELRQWNDKKLPLSAIINLVFNKNFNYNRRIDNDVLASYFEYYEKKKGTTLPIDKDTQNVNESVEDAKLRDVLTHVMEKSIGGVWGLTNFDSPLYQELLHHNIKKESLLSSGEIDKKIKKLDPQIKKYLGLRSIQNPRLLDREQGLLSRSQRIYFKRLRRRQRRLIELKSRRINVFKSIKGFNKSISILDGMKNFTFIRSFVKSGSYFKSLVKSYKQRPNTSFVEVLRQPNIFIGDLQKKKAAFLKSNLDFKSKVVPYEKWHELRKVFTELEFLKESWLEKRKVLKTIPRAKQEDHLDLFLNLSDTRKSFTSKMNELKKLWHRYNFRWRVRNPDHFELVKKIEKSTQVGSRPWDNEKALLLNINYAFIGKKKKKAKKFHKKFCFFDRQENMFSLEFIKLSHIFFLIVFLKEKTLFGALTTKETDLLVSLKTKWLVQFEKTVKLLQSLERREFSSFLKRFVASRRCNTFYNKVASIFYQVDFINDKIEDHFIYRRQVYKTKQRDKTKRLEVAVLYLLRSFCIFNTTREKPLVSEHYMSVFYNLIMLQRKKNEASLKYILSMNINNFALRHSKNSGMAYKLTYNKFHNQQLEFLKELEEHAKIKKFSLGGRRYDQCEFLYGVELLLTVINSRPSWLSFNQDHSIFYKNIRLGFRALWAKQQNLFEKNWGLKEQTHFGISFMSNKKYKAQFLQKKFVPRKLLSHFSNYRPFTEISESDHWSEIKKLQVAKDKAIRLFTNIGTAERRYQLGRSRSALFLNAHRRQERLLFQLLHINPHFFEEDSEKAKIALRWYDESSFVLPWQDTTVVKFSMETTRRLARPTRDFTCFAPYQRPIKSILDFSLFITEAHAYTFQKRGLFNKLFYKCNYETILKKNIFEGFFIYALGYAGTSQNKRYRSNRKKLLKGMEFLVNTWHAMYKHERLFKYKIDLLFLFCSEKEMATMALEFNLWIALKREWNEPANRLMPNIKRTKKLINEKYQTIMYYHLHDNWNKELWTLFWVAHKSILQVAQDLKYKDSFPGSTELAYELIEAESLFINNKYIIQDSFDRVIWSRELTGWRKTMHVPLQIVQKETQEDGLKWWRHNYDLLQGIVKKMNKVLDKCYVHMSPYRKKQINLFRRVMRVRWPTDKTMAWMKSCRKNAYFRARKLIAYGELPDFVEKQWFDKWFMFKTIYSSKKMFDKAAAETDKKKPPTFWDHKAKQVKKRKYPEDKNKKSYGWDQSKKKAHVPRRKYNKAYRDKLNKNKDIFRKYNF